MRWSYSFIFILILASADLISAQTFTVTQPSSTKKTTTKVVRPDAETASAPSASTNAKHTEKVREVKREHVTKRTDHKIAAKTAKPAPVAADPAPIPSVAKTVPPPPVDPEKLPLPTTSEFSSPELQQHIQRSLSADANLSSANGLHVAVTDDTVTLDGTVATAQEKLEAGRLAQSYAGNRIFKDNLQIAGAQPSSEAKVAGAPPQQITPQTVLNSGNTFSNPK